MNLKKVLKNSLLIFAPFFLIILIIFSSIIIKKDFQYGNLPLYFWPGKVDLLNYYFETNLKKIHNKYFDDQKIGLKKVNFFIPEKNLSHLMSNLPISANNYVGGYILNDKKMQKIKFKYKGSNPMNWLFEQKEIRYKLHKKKIKNKIRYYDYATTQNELINNYIYFKLAEKMIKSSYDVQLVEVFLNNQSKGIYIERNPLNESFLRRKKFMPVNLYKGENYRYDDKSIGLENNLFHNAGLWQKISILNSMKIDDFSDLENFLDLIRESKESEVKMNELLDFNNLEIFSNFGAFQILTQAIVVDYDHNLRLIIDPWSGLKHIIPHDDSINMDMNKNNIKLDFFNNDLFSSLSLSSVYLEKKYQRTYNILNNEKIIDLMINEIEKLREKFNISFKRDIGTIQRKYITPDIGKEDLNSLDLLIRLLNERKKNINSVFEKNPESSWEIDKKGFSLKIKDELPISNLSIEFHGNKPNWIVLDYNNNGFIDKNDVYFYPYNNGKFLIDVKFFSNRILTYKNTLNNTSSTTKEVFIQNTKFNFFVDKNIEPKEIKGSNDFTQEKFIIKKEENLSFLPIMHNKPILNKKKNKIILNGIVKINEDKIYNTPVEINEGTIFELCKKCSLIFKNKITAIGSKKKPIIFKGKNDDYWGSLGLIGKNTSGSKLKNIIIKNGTGAKINGINFYASLSIHSTKNISISNLKMENNKIYDDMMHIVYSDNINIKDSSFNNSFADSIDIDISNNINLSNLKITNSKNDGIDFMESTANIKNVIVEKSGDKGLSVGENSKITVTDSFISNNKYGIVSKDNSIVNVINSEIVNNKIQLSVYKKNWRYGNSGKINIKNIKLNKNQNIFEKDKNGQINFISKNIYQNTKINEINEFSLN